MRPSARPARRSLSQGPPSRDLGRSTCKGGVQRPDETQKPKEAVIETKLIETENKDTTNIYDVPLVTKIRESIKPERIESGSTDQRDRSKQSLKLPCAKNLQWPAAKWTQISQGGRRGVLRRAHARHHICGCARTQRASRSAHASALSIHAQCPTQQSSAVSDHVLGIHRECASSSLLHIMHDRRQYSKATRDEHSQELTGNHLMDRV